MGTWKKDSKGNWKKTSKPKTNYTIKDGKKVATSQTGTKAGTVSDTWNKDTVTLAEAKQQSKEAASYLEAKSEANHQDVTGVADSWNKESVSLSEAVSQTSSAESYLISAGTQEQERKAVAAQQAAEAKAAEAEALRNEYNAASQTEKMRILARSQTGGLLNKFNTGINQGTPKAGITLTGERGNALYNAAQKINSNKSINRGTQSSVSLLPGETVKEANPTRMIISGLAGAGSGIKNSLIAGYGAGAGKSDADTGLSYKSRDYKSYGLYNRTTNAVEAITGRVDDATMKGAKAIADRIPQDKKITLATPLGFVDVDSNRAKRGAYSAAQLVTGTVEGVAGTAQIVGGVPLAAEMFLKNPGKTAKAALVGTGIIVGATVKGAAENPTRTIGNLAGGILVGKAAGKVAKTATQKPTKIIDTPGSAEVLEGYTIRKLAGQDKPKVVAKTSTVPLDAIPAEELAVFKKLDLTKDRVLKAKFVKSTAKDGAVSQTSGVGYITIKGTGTRSQLRLTKKGQSTFLETLAKNIEGENFITNKGNVPLNSAVEGVGKMRLTSGTHSGLDVELVRGRTSGGVDLEVSIPKTPKGVKPRAVDSIEQYESSRVKNSMKSVESDPFSDLVESESYMKRLLPRVGDEMSQSGNYEYVRGRVVPEASAVGKSPTGLTGEFKTVAVEPTAKTRAGWGQGLSGFDDMEGGVVKTGRTKTVAGTWEMPALDKFKSSMVISDDVVPLAYDKAGVPTNVQPGQRGFLGVTGKVKGAVGRISDDAVPKNPWEFKTAEGSKLLVNTKRAGKLIEPDVIKKAQVNLGKKATARNGITGEEIKGVYGEQKSKIPLFKNKPTKPAGGTGGGEYRGSSGSAMAKAEAATKPKLVDYTANQILKVTPASRQVIPGGSNAFLEAISKAGVTAAGITGSVATAKQRTAPISKATQTVAQETRASQKPVISITPTSQIMSGQKQNSMISLKQNQVPRQKQNAILDVSPIQEIRQNTGQTNMGFLSPGYRIPRLGIKEPVLTTGSAGKKRSKSTKKSGSVGVDRRIAENQFKNIWELI